VEFAHRISVSKRPDEKNLAEWVVTSNDWLYCTDAIVFMNPVYFVLKGLEGKKREQSVSSLFIVRLFYDLYSSFFTF
jgi:hypothetical protein